MKINIHLFYFLLLSLGTTILFSDCSPKMADGKTSNLLFDGKSTTGWEGNMDWFRIEDQAVVAGTLEKPIIQNEFLCTEQLYENFELRLKAKAKGKGVNAGIQFRTKRIPNHHEVIGYQCDIGSVSEGHVWGYLYDESRRKKFLTTPDRAALKGVLKPNEWNEFVIRAEGARIQIWLNGHQTVDFTEMDNSISTNGVICLQIHSGGPSEAWYKDIELKEL